jgi:hypothetical protein
MGFAASQARVMMLTSRKSDLELQVQFINQARMQLANTVGTLYQLTANLEPESATAKSLSAQISAIQTLDKGLELQGKRMESQREAMTTELEAVRKVITANISSSFKTFA